jgi:hypothetical protein
MQKLKQRWGITSNFQILIILFVFSITGSASLYVSRPVIALLGIRTDTMHPILYWILFVLISFIFYQNFLLIFGWIFGQSNFFWNKMVKKMLVRMKILKKVGSKKIS